MLRLLYLTVLHNDRIEERHGFAELRADFLDLMGCFFLANTSELVAPGLVFVDEFLSEGAVLNVVEEALHSLLDFRGYDAWTCGVVAPLSGVGDGVTHVFEAAAIHEVHDELELVENLEVGELG